METANEQNPDNPNLLFQLQKLLQGERRNRLPTVLPEDEKENRRERLLSGFSTDKARRRL